MYLLCVIFSSPFLLLYSSNNNFKQISNIDFNTRPQGYQTLVLTRKPSRV